MQDNSQSHKKKEGPDLGLLAKEYKEKEEGGGAIRVYKIMEPKWLNAIWNGILFSGLTLFAIFGTRPTLAVDIRAPAEVIVENGTTGVLKCFFKSNEVVSSQATVHWHVRQLGSDETSTITFYSNGINYPVDAFKKRLQFIGDLNKKDASIQLLNAKFSDNGTYFCDVKNPPDVAGTPARTELRVVARESLPQDSTAVIVGAVCGAVIGIVLIAVVTYLIIRRHQSRHDYEGCTSVESASSPTPRPRKKVDASVEGSGGGRPSGPVQGPVIYAQLDHSSIKSPNSFHKLEPVVYADIRKN